MTALGEAAPAVAPTSERDDQTPPRGRGRRRFTVAVLVSVAVVVVLGLSIADPFGQSLRRQATGDNGAPTALAVVRRGTLSSQVNQAGTLGYAAQSDGSPYTVVNQASGAFTRLPSIGQTIEPGRVLYRVDGNPVILLDGPTPAYRTLYEGLIGPDVRELNANLVALRCATRSELDPSSDYFNSETASALERLQHKLGMTETGELKLGEAVFLAAPLRITKVLATLGTTAGVGTPVAQATTTHRQVVVQLSAGQQSSVRVGDRVLVTLPNNKTTPGVVTGIGTVASGSSSSATVPVYIALKRPQVAGRLDQAPVEVRISVGVARHALIVPVDALLALAGGGYAVETVKANGRHQLVPVTTGLFDDANGLVQVSGALSPGQRVVVPAT